MMQTRLMPAPSTQAVTADNPLAPASLNGEKRDVRAAEGKGGFAMQMATAQGEDGKAAMSGGKPSGAITLDKSGSVTKASDSSSEDESAVSQEGAANDFLLHLQDSLKLDTTLVTPLPTPALLAEQGGAALLNDGKMLPQADESEVSDGIEPDVMDKKAGSDTAAKLLEGEFADTVHKGVAADSNKQEEATEGQEKPPIAPLEKAALIGAADQEALDLHELIAPEGSVKPLTPPEAKPEVKEGAPVAVAVKPDPVITTTPVEEKAQAVLPRQPAAEPAETPPHRVSQDVAPAPRPSDGAHVTSPVMTHAASPTPPAASDPAPVPVLPQQALAEAQPQGPQAPLSAITAGIQQLAVAEASETRKGKLEVREKVGELAKSSGLVATLTSEEGNRQVPSASTPSPQGSPTQPALTENRPGVGADTALRREPASLPHLKLASPEAPAELQHKVNLMLADKLQQAEVQLDPLGLGKMKIQIQIGADQQASVNFVVQHNQTREMVEQSMPRLREMLAGQGIQLGQTQVQQQSQQQGHSAFSGQGKESGQGGQHGSGSDFNEGDVAVSTMSLSVESTNSSGIDFYA